MFAPDAIATKGPSDDEGRYRLVRRIGAGGMAEVFLARQRLADLGDRAVVVKQMLPHLAGDPKFVRLFVREAKIASQLAHPNVVQILDVATIGGRPSIVMEHLRGIDARAAFRAASRSGQGLDAPTALAIVEQAARGLDHAHHATDENGTPLAIVHRDVSPHNVFLTRQGVVKILDFGIARLGREETATASVKGKLAYMAPEQAFRQPLDGRADLFSLGVVLWELLTGRRLFRGDSPAETLGMLLDAEIPPASTFAPVPPALDALARRALDREPAARFQRGDALAAELAAARTSLSSEAPTALVARLVERLAPAENTPTVPTRPDTDVAALAAAARSPLAVDVDLASLADEMAGDVAVGAEGASERDDEDTEGGPGAARRRAHPRPAAAGRTKALAVGALALAGLAAFALAYGRPPDAATPTPERPVADAPPPRVPVRGVPEGASLEVDGLVVPADAVPAARGARAVRVLREGQTLWEGRAVIDGLAPVTLPVPAPSPSTASTPHVVPPSPRRADERRPATSTRRGRGVGGDIDRDYP